MKRRGFLGTIAAAITIPAVAKTQSKKDKSYAFEYADAVHKESVRGSAEAMIFIKDGKVYLDPFKPSHLRPGQIVMTDKGDMLHVIAPHLTVSDVNGQEYKQYLCSFLEGPKLICRRQVIKVAGKYRLLKNCDGLTYKVNYAICASAFVEGGVSS